MKLEIKHICGYLPYELEIANVSLKGKIISTYIMELNNYDNRGIENVLYGVNQIPLLHPLSDLTKPIVHKGEEFTPRERLIEKYSKLEVRYRSSQPEKYIDGCIAYLSEPKGYDRIPHWMYQDLIKWHFDIFGLIPSGLALDINQVEK